MGNLFEGFLVLDKPGFHSEQPVLVFERILLAGKKIVPTFGDLKRRGS